MRRLLPIIVVALFAVACGSSEPGGGSVEGAWVLESGMMNGETVPIVENHPITMLLQDADISGTAACNRYFGGYSVSGDDFSLTDGVAVTEMACVSDELMESERAYLEALLNVDTARVVADDLVLSGSQAELVYVPDPDGPPPDASGGTDDPDTPVSSSILGPATQGAWELVSGTLDGETIPLVDTHPITLTIEGELMAGTAACNDYGFARPDEESEWEIGSTAMLCSPLEVMESEEAYLEALRRVEEGVLEDELLVLLGEGMELRFRALHPVPIAELRGTVWLLESTLHGDDVTPVAGEKATLELFDDGSVTGSTGCRTFAGSYVVSGAEVLVTELAMDGECTDELADQDSSVVTVLGDGFRAELEDDTLRLWSMGDEGLVYRAES